MISREFALHLPGWKDDIALHPDNYYLIMSDDMDSFYSCRFLMKKLKVPFGGFYDFSRGLYLTNAIDTSCRYPVYVDASCVKDGVMTFDNHRTLPCNHMAINPNLIVDRCSDKSYYQKYCGSTLMLVVALYGDIDNLTELEKEFMIAIDGFYMGYYKNDGAFKEVNTRWLDVLGLKKVLLPILEAHDIQYFIDLISEWNLKEKIYIHNGELYTYRDDILPKDKLTLTMPAHSECLKKDVVATTALTNEQLFMASETYNGRYITSITNK